MGAISRRSGRAEQTTGYDFSSLTNYFEKNRISGQSNASIRTGIVSSAASLGATAPFIGFGTASEKTFTTISEATKNKNRPLTKEEFGRLQTEFNGSYGTQWKDTGKDFDKAYDAYLQFIDDNAKEFGFNSKDEASNDTSSLDTDFYNRLTTSENELKDSLMLSSNDAQAQQYKQDMYGSLDAYEADLNASLAASEMSAYQQIGQQQLELENTIAEQRMKALKSGTTSAQLAAQQLANMFAAQSGAAQVANNLFASRQQNAAQIAQSRYGITQDLYNMINTNQQTYANARAQYAATMGNYAATVNQPYAQYNAWKGLSLAEREMLNTNYQKQGK